MKSLLTISKFSFRQAIERSAYKYAIIIQPILFSVLFYLINVASGQGLSAMAIVGKSGMISLWSSVCFSSLCDLQREKDSRTLAALLVTPTSLFKVILGKVIPNTLMGVISFCVSAITIIILSRGRMDIEMSFCGIIICLFILLLSYIATAMFFIPIFSIYENARLLINCIEYPIFIITGMAFPTSLLPGIIQRVGELLPLTWGVKIFNNIITKHDLSAINYGDIKVYIIIISIYVAIDVVLFEIVERKIRINATIRI